MKYLWILILLAFSTNIFAQKIKVKKGIVSIDEVEQFKLDKKSTYNTEFYSVKSLSDEDLLTVEYKELYAYWKGPKMNYFVLMDAAKTDSCLIDYRNNSGNKNIAKLLYSNQMIVDNKLDLASFAKLKVGMNQDTVTDFLKKHELSYDKLVERSAYGKLKLSITEGAFKYDNRYRIFVGESVSSKTIGYLVMKEKILSEDNKYAAFFIHLPNGLLVAQCHTVTANIKSDKLRQINSVVTIVDDERHVQTRQPTPAGLLAMLEDLASKGYL